MKIQGNSLFYSMIPLFTTKCHAVSTDDSEMSICQQTKLQGDIACNMIKYMKYRL